MSDLLNQSECVLPKEIQDALTYETTQAHSVSKKDARELLDLTLNEIPNDLPLTDVISEVRTRLQLTGIPIDKPEAISLSSFLLKNETAQVATVIRVQNISFGYGGRKLLDRITLDLNSTAKQALIGLNGSGKSTLIKLLVGELEPEDGNIQIVKGRKFGYLPQSNTLSDEQKERSVIEEIKTVPCDVINLKNKLAETDWQIEALSKDATFKEIERLLQRQARLRELYEEKDGYTFEGIYEPLLLAFGFTPDHFYRSLSSLSGGELTKLLLAKIILERPDLLILDEPTNNLDIEGIKWLEAFLQSWQKGILCVSHERELINQFDRIIEIERGRATVYTDNYESYVAQKDLAYQQALATYKRQQAEIKRQMEIYRFLQRKPSTRAKAKKHREKAEKLKQEAIEKPTTAKQVRALRIRPKERIRRLVCKCNHLVIGYDSPLIEFPKRLEIHKGQRIGIMGRNGIGKTTFLRTLVGEIAPFEGEIDFREPSQVGYLSQIQTSLNLEKTAVEEVMGQTGGNYNQTRKILGQLLIPPESVDIPINNLSGGERSKICLAIVMLKNPAVLILDEPTNHFDIPSREALEEALEKYEGTIICISHDRYLVNRICEEIWMFREARIEKLYPDQI